MQVRRLDHVNIQATQVEAMVQWYRVILGLRTGPRPDFPFPARGYMRERMPLST